MLKYKEINYKETFKLFHCGRWGTFVIEIDKRWINQYHL
jgi:hypothetical protein